MSRNIVEIAVEMVEVRHHLHRNPELSFKEVSTCAYIMEVLSAQGINVQRVANTGVLAILEGSADCCCDFGDTLIRADIDALPIIEMSDCDFSSENGAMHACGHDIHTAVLMGVTLWLSENRDKFSGRVIALFQPGEEESPGGASVVISEKILDKFNIKRAFALHTAHDISVGYFGARVGEYMASTSEMRITVSGRGGHAALPTMVVNPIIKASQFMLALDELNRQYDNVIVAVGRFVADGSTNIIPSTVSMAGTVRAMTSQGKNDLKERITSLAASFGDVEISFTDGYPPVFNNVELSKKAISILRNRFGAEAVADLGLRMTADDFGFFAALYPSFYFRLGVKGEWDGVFAPHTPQFRADDKAISYGIEAMVELIVNINR